MEIIDKLISLLTPIPGHDYVNVTPLELCDVLYQYCNPFFATTALTSHTCTCKQPSTIDADADAMVLQDLGRRINTAVSDLTRAPNLDEKVTIHSPPRPFQGNALT